ncbi:MAG: tetratricopeptide repeat protein [Anaerococcus hydrogenalis]|nr:tetratricopeptide repeat protein [Anaerococcus hydrogenalis]
MKYDLSNFYKDLKLKFNKSNGKEVILFLMEEFSKTISLKDERAIIAVGNELASFLRVKGQTDFAYKIYKVIQKLVLDSYGFISKDYASLLINISNCDIVAKDYDMAIKNLNETENILKQLEDTKYLMASVYNNRSQAYRAKNMLDLAQEDIENALKIIENEEKIAVSKINLAEILILKKKFSKALVNANEAIFYYEKNKLRLPHLANAYATAANIYYNNKEYYTSIYYYEKALEVFDETVGKGPVRDILIKNLNQAKKQRDMS